jgi:rod shape-determining protein MreD
VHKINRFQIYLILITAFFLQVTFLNYMKVSGVKPDIVLACVIFFGLFAGAGVGFESGIAAGIMTDLFVLDFFGINTYLFSLVGFLAGVVNINFFRESKRTQTLLVFLFTSLCMTLHYIVISFISRNISFGYGEYLMRSIIPASIYTSLAAIPIFSAFLAIYDSGEAEELL